MRETAVLSAIGSGLRPGGAQRPRFRRGSGRGGGVRRLGIQAERVAAGLPGKDCRGFAIGRGRGDQILPVVEVEPVVPRAGRTNGE